MSSANFDVIFVEKDGSVISELIYKYKPDIVLLDVFMQKIDALGVLKKLKEAGTDIIVVGSGIINSDDYKKTIKELKKEIEALKNK